jgi:hypothetical protein
MHGVLATLVELLSFRNKIETTRVQCVLLKECLVELEVIKWLKINVVLRGDSLQVVTKHWKGK